MKEYRAAVYNIFKCAIPGSKEYLGSLIKDCDFVALQEWVSDITTPPHQHIITTSTFKLPMRGKETGTAIISHVSPHKQDSCLSPRRELGFVTRKSATMGRYLLDGKEITVMSCHLLNFVPYSLWEEALTAFVRELPKEGPVLLLGDFNTWSRRRMSRMWQILHEQRLIYADYEGNPLLRLDHIWYRDLEVKNVLAHTHSHRSDHYPLTFNFSFLS